jgi:hypothetical protein
VRLSTNILNGGYHGQETTEKSFAATRKNKQSTKKYSTPRKTKSKIWQQIIVFFDRLSPQMGGGLYSRHGAQEIRRIFKIPRRRL